MNNADAIFVGEAIVGPGGRLELHTSLPPQSHVRVVCRVADDTVDLVNAATSSLSMLGSLCMRGLMMELFSGRESRKEYTAELHPKVIIWNAPL